MTAKAWHCSVCGSKDVIIGATAKWDEAQQEWVVSDINDSSDNDYCYDCDDWHHVEERDLTDLKAAAQAAIVAINKESQG
jgi:hypothetical protein